MHSACRLGVDTRKRRPNELVRMRCKPAQDKKQRVVYCTYTRIYTRLINSLPLPKTLELKGAPRKGARWPKKSELVGSSPVNAIHDCRGGSSG